VLTPGSLETPETYIGTARAEGWVVPPRNGLSTYPGADSLPVNRFALKGTWRIGTQPAVAVSDASITAHVVGRYVYLVLGSAGGRPRTVSVTLDGHPMPARLAGADVHDGRLVVRGQRLYRIAAFGTARDHVLGLSFAPGVVAYSFTFG
jgi:hypothetical protein